MNARHTSFHDDEGLIDSISARLAPRYTRTFSAETIRWFVRDSLAALRETATISTYLALLAERDAAQRLDSGARFGADATEAPAVRSGVQTPAS